MARHPDLAAFIRDHVVERGEFTLASGAKSTFYIDGKKATLEPRGMRLVAEAVHRELREWRVDAVAGLELGAIPMVCTVAALSGETPVSALMVRKATKGHGLGKRVEGQLRPGLRVAILEDVVTSGKSIVDAIGAVRAEGGEVVGAVTLVDRNAGGQAAVEALGVPYVALVTLADLDL